MAITSIGYDNSVNEQGMAAWWEYMGKGPCVASSGSWAVTARTGVDRTVRVATGSGAAKGVYDTSDTTYDVVLPATVGSPVWHTIVRHIDWGTNLTTFSSVKGGTTQVVAPGLANSPGSVFDHPLALARVSQGVQVPDQIVDLRFTLAQMQAGWGPWKALDLLNGTYQQGTSGVGLQYRTTIDGRDVELRGTVRRNPDTATVKGGTTIAQLPPEITPTSYRRYVCPSDLRGSDLHTAVGDGGAYTLNQAYSLHGAINSDGLLLVYGDYEPFYVCFDGWRYTRFSSLG